MHGVAVTAGEIKVGKPVELAVDHARRSAIRANHSATHLIHEGLRLVLGDHVAQKGSLVSGERLRFDISHPKPIAADELVTVEDLVNAQVVANTAVVTKLMGAAGSGGIRRPRAVRREVWR